MKKLILSFIAALAATTMQAAYTITNDLQSTVVVFYWTNNGTAYTFQNYSNMVPASKSAFTNYLTGSSGLGVQATNSTISLLVTNVSLHGTGDNVSDLFNIALATLAPLAETVPQSQLVLKSYYVTGAVPSQANYWEWIDSMFWYINQTYTNALLAQQALTTIEANGLTIVATASGSVPINNSGIGDTETATWAHSFNVSATVTYPHYNDKIKFSFTTPISGAYFVYLGTSFNTSSNSTPIITSQTSTDFTVAYPPGSSLYVPEEVPTSLSFYITQ